MTPRAATLVIDRSTERDVPTIAGIAYDTAFFGASAAAFFPAERLFADLWVKPYLAVGHVLVARAEACVIGYCLGVDHPRTHARGVARVLPAIVTRLLLGGYPGARRCLRFAASALRDRHPRAPHDAFPAHLHLNVRAEARGLGAGRALLERYLSDARARGVPGIQLSTTSRNVAAVALYASLGFTVWSRSEARRWRPWLDAPIDHLVMTLRL